MRYPVCGMAHPAIDALRELLAEHRLAAKDVKAVRVAASKFVVDMVGRPYRPGKNPEVDAQFNLSYCLATVLQTASMHLGDHAMENTLGQARRARADTIPVRLDEALMGKAEARGEEVGSAARRAGVGTSRTKS